MIEEKLKALIRDVPDFPQKGILFRDITPVLLKPELTNEIVDAFIENIKDKVDVVCAIESRGFLYGMLLAQRLGVPFVPVRKEGKLPGETIAYSYQLEYGYATVEVHRGDIKPGSKVLIHDDLLATGGTAAAAAELVKLLRAEVAGFTFLICLESLPGRERLKAYGAEVVALAGYK